jgi:radical SAM superfamily enzyme YgiQ (UPF0313 family)
MGAFSVQLMESLPAHKKTGLTFAPEAGSERLRSCINKGVTEEGILATAAAAFQKGWNGLKLYFMLGLPTETDDDAVAIADLINRIYAEGAKAGARAPQLRVNLSTFVPKPHTPFQRAAREDDSRTAARHEIVRRGVRKKAVRVSWSDPRVSRLEAAMSRGDRRLGQVIFRAWKLGCLFDSWGEHFNHELWQQAFQDCGIDPDVYASRERAIDEPLPWDHIDVGVSPAFLKEEYRRALAGEHTIDCRNEACNVCGLQSKDPTCREKARALGR